MVEAQPWTIRVYEPGDEHDILELFNSVFRVDNPDFVPRKLSHWNWRFRDNPEGHQTLLAIADDRVVGLYTGIPARWRFPYGTGLGTQAVDSCIAPEYRRSLRKTGLFMTLARQWFDEFRGPDKNHIGYGFPNPQAFRIGTKRLGYLPVRSPQIEQSLSLQAALEFADTAIHVEEVDEFGGAGGLCVHDAGDPGDDAGPV